MRASVVVAGATGAVGIETLRIARERGYRVTALSRGAARLQGQADRVIAFDATEGLPELAGHDAVISALGASVAMSHADRRGFRAVDFAGNLNLLKAAKRARIGRFVYVAAHVAPGYADTAYIRAHEEFVSALIVSGLSYTVLRPTGIFTAFRDFIPMARRGMLMVLGDGSARTNPIHQSDVAGHCVNAIEDGPKQQSIGGPEILTRRQVAELAFQAVGKRPRIVRLPASVMAGAGSLAKFMNPRLGEMLQFVSRVAVVDCVAPAAGTLRLEEYFHQGTPEGVLTR